LAEKNDGLPVESRRITVKGEQVFSRDFNLRENDVYLITLEK
jgi:hypothetical protein